MLETQAALNGLDSSQMQASDSAKNLTESVNGIGKKISLDQVISGINSITGAMEKAAAKAVDLGQKIWENVLDAAKWADDTQTMALMYEVPLETLLQRILRNEITDAKTVAGVLKAKLYLNI